MVGWHHQLNGHEFEQVPGDGEGQGSLVCCIPWGRRVGHDLVAEHQRKRTDTDTRSTQSHPQSSRWPRRAGLSPHILQRATLRFKEVG